MHTAARSRTLLLAGALLVIATLSGCGSSTPKPAPAREARLVAEANALCASIVHNRAHATQTQKLEEQHHLAALEKAVRQAAAYLPAGRSLDEAHTKRLALLQAFQRELRAQTHGHTPTRPTIVITHPKEEPFYFIDESYRLQMQAYNAVKALGLTECVGKPPRAPISG